MTLRIAINGFGRIGRLVLRSMIENPRKNIEIIAINDLGNIDTNIHLLKYDSVHGTLQNSITSQNNNLLINNQEIKVYSQRNPKDLPWKNLDIDIVLECTGIFLDFNSVSRHLDAGAKRVLISAPAKDNIKTIVYSVNDHILTKNDIIVSNASCTTNCLAPIAQILDESVGIQKGFMTTIHSFTGDQQIVDSLHPDLRRARAASLSMIPSKTGAAKAVGLVLPQLKGKIDGTAIRVPTPNVSLVDFSFLSNRKTTIDEINISMIKAANGSMKDVLSICEESLVSIDFNHNHFSSVFDITQTKVLDGNFIRILSWYDNEWGFANRMLDTAYKMAHFL